MQIENVKRYKPNIHTGLSDEQIDERKKDNLVNYDTSVPTKSIKRIIAENLFTIFNILNIGLAIAILCVESYKNLLFLGIVFCNIIISIAQEIHSKKMIDKLSIISAIQLDVVRNSKIEKIKIDEIVLDDILILNAGNQIVTDCIVLDGEIEVNESFITGEPDNVLKQKGEMILSGSFVVSGKCSAQVEHIGNDNYTSAISSGAKNVKKVKSEIMNSLNKIIKIATIIIIPLGILLFLNQLKITDNTFQNAVINTVAAVIGMIPEGLVLLISTVLAVSVIRLSKQRVLVQSLFCIETLARVDTLCLDKTGTITENKMKLDNIVAIDSTMDEINQALIAMSSYTEDINGTIDAIKDHYTERIDTLNVISKVPFTSQKKWSGISFENKGSYIIGSPEFVLKDKINKYQDFINKYIDDNRVIILVHSKNDFVNKELPIDIRVMGFIMINNKIRPEASNTIKYFKEQGVDIKIISGDNAITVSKIAKKVGIDTFDKYIDATLLDTEEKIQDSVDKYTIFGRVTPTQKKSLIKALKLKGHTVAMTGDGVNDVLALQESDCGIAVASGSEAARNVSQLVLLDSNFEAMPKIVAEGRRTINNIERSATLFLSKTIYATVLAFIFLFISAPYPFMPIQLTLISMVTIGIPSFILALEPNHELVKGKFMSNVIKRALPSALAVLLNIIIIIIANKIFDLSLETFSTLCVISTGIVGLILLARLCMPLNIIRGSLFVLMTLAFVIGIIIFKSLLSLCAISINMLTFIILLTIIAIVAYKVFELLMDKLLKNKSIKLLDN
ncbi:MAG: HAD-IC family P-type ATPase [Clostridia bacterium]